MSADDPEVPTDEGRVRGLSKASSERTIIKLQVMLAKLASCYRVSRHNGQ